MCYHPSYRPSAPAYNLTGPAHVHLHFVETVTITYQLEVDVWT